MLNSEGSNKIFLAVKVQTIHDEQWRSRPDILNSECQDQAFWIVKVQTNNA